MRKLENIARLGVKELYSLARDPLLVFLIVWVFTMAIYTVATGAKMEVVNASVAIVDEDASALSRRIRDALLAPEFQQPERIALEQVDRDMDHGEYVFVLDIPPDFESDVLAGERPRIQLIVDATAMSVAATGAAYIQQIVRHETRNFVEGHEDATAFPASLNINTLFNPNLRSSWFMAVMQIINNVSILAIVLAGAAVIREREHGTIEHLLVMPLTPGQIMLSKIWANGVVIVIAATLSLIFVVRWALGIPIVGSITLFVLGACLYLFSVTALGIVLATIAKSMPQFGLLALPVFVVMNLLSGSTTPLDSMPEALQIIMQGAPSTHFVEFSQSVLYRGAGLAIVWPSLLAIAGIGLVLFLFALARFRRALVGAAG